MLFTLLLGQFYIRNDEMATNSIYLIYLEFVNTNYESDATYNERLIIVNID